MNRTGYSYWSIIFRNNNSRTCFCLNISMSLTTLPNYCAEMFLNPGSSDSLECQIPILNDGLSENP